MNPVIDQWLSLWDKLTGRSYPRYRTPRWDLLEWQTTRLVNYAYGYMTYETALDMLNRGTLKPYFRYRHFSKPKKDGKLRELVEPDVNLKAIQRLILKRYLEKEPLHQAAVGFRSKKSITDHVWPHAGAAIIIASDIQDFFPSTNRWRVEDWWIKLLQSEQAAKLLTILTTYHGGLPQGAPTSPALSNLLNQQMDSRLFNAARDSGATYTRYCDDMLFSWQGKRQPPADFEQIVKSTLREFGYTAHPDKGWQVYSRRDEPEVTGVVLNKHGRVEIPERLHQIMRELRKSDNPYDKARLLGYESYRQMVEKR